MMTPTMRMRGKIVPKVLPRTVGSLFFPPWLVLGKRTQTRFQLSIIIKRNTFFFVSWGSKTQDQNKSTPFRAAVLSKVVSLVSAAVPLGTVTTAVLIVTLLIVIVATRRVLIAAAVFSCNI